MDKDINVLICEDEATWREIIEKYMLPGKVTFASLFKAEKRSEIVEALESVKADEQYLSGPGKGEGGDWSNQD